MKLSNPWHTIQFSTVYQNHEMVREKSLCLSKRTTWLKEEWKKRKRRKAPWEGFGTVTVMQWANRQSARGISSMAGGKCRKDEGNHSGLLAKANGISSPSPYPNPNPTIHKGRGSKSTGWGGSAPCHWWKETQKAMDNLPGAVDAGADGSMGQRSMFLHAGQVRPPLFIWHFTTSITKA